MKSKRLIVLLLSLTLIVSIAIPGTLAVSVDQILVCRQLAQSHRSPGVQLLRTDTDLGAQTELGSVRKGRRNVGINASRVDTLLELSNRSGILGHDRLAVTRRVASDMLYRLVERPDRADRHTVREELGPIAMLVGML